MRTQQMNAGAIAVASLVLVIVCSKSIGASLWLDELYATWAISGSFTLCIDRVAQHQGSGFLYYEILWIWANVLGNSEIALRSLSLLSVVISIPVLFSIASTLFRPEIARLAVLLYGVNSLTTYAALNAKPYGLALLLSLLVISSAQKYCQRVEFKFLLLFGISSCALGYTHYLFLLVMPLVFLLPFLSGTLSLRNFMHLTGAACFAILGCLPQIPSFLYLAKNSVLFSFAPMPTLRLLLGTWLSLDTVVIFFLVWLILAALGRDRPLLRLLLGLRSPKVAVVLLWVLLPPAFLAAASMITGRSVFIERYFLWQAPGLALLGALLLSALPHALTQISAAVFTVIILGSWSVVSFDEDWRGASRFVATHKLLESSKFLLYSEMVESRRIDMLSSPEHYPYFTMSMGYYPFPSHPILLPLSAQMPGYEEYWNDQVVPELKDTESVLALVVNSSLIDIADETSVEVYQARLEALGYSIVRHYFGRVVVLEGKNVNSQGEIKENGRNLAF